MDVVTRRWLLATGCTDERIVAQVGAGRWQRPHPGVVVTYAGALRRETELTAALAYAGPGATLSHETAAEVWGLVDVAGDLVHVTVPVSRRVRSRPGVQIHYAHRLDTSRHPTHDPPVTDVEDTVLDLVDRCRYARDAVGWVSRACQRRRTTPDRLLVALADRKKIKWRELIAGALSDVSDGAETPLEQEYLHRVERAHGLPAGRRQRHRRVGLGSQWIDVVYAELGVIVELDGRIGHVDDGVFRDRDRDNVSAAAGKLTLRYGWAEVHADSCRTARQVDAVLEKAGRQKRGRACSPSCTAYAFLTPR